jgi:hypothetical protein
LRTTGHRTAIPAAQSLSPRSSAALCSSPSLWSHNTRLRAAGVVSLAAVKLDDGIRTTAQCFGSRLRNFSGRKNKHRRALSTRALVATHAKEERFAESSVS